MIGKWKPINLKWRRKDEIFAQLRILEANLPSMIEQGEDHEKAVYSAMGALRVELADIEATETQEERTAYYAR